MTETAEAGAALRRPKPQTRPARPYFSSGPCAKPPGWSAVAAAHRGARPLASRGARQGAARRSDRADACACSSCPHDYRLGIVPASDTGAMEMAIWSLLGDSAGHHAGVGKLRRRLGDRRRQAAQARRRDPHRRLRRASGPRRNRSGERRRLHLERHDQRRARAQRRLDRRRTAPASRSATQPPAPSRRTSTGPRSMSAPSAGRRRSAAKRRTACSCSRPRAVERLEREPAPRPLPKIFRLTKGGKLIDGIFKGETINTPSMLCVEDWLFALDWAERIGGLEALIARADANAAALDRWVQERRLDRAPRQGCRRSARTRRCACNSPTAPTSRRTRRGRKRSPSCSKQEDAAYDIGAYRDAPPGLRIWCGATVDTGDIEALGPWLDWAWDAHVRPDREVPARSASGALSLTDHPSNRRFPGLPAGMTR